MREEHLISRVKSLVEEYSYSQPFAVFLRDHFRHHREMGARDRRETREWCFNYFRIGKNLETLEFSQRLAISNFLCSKAAYPSLSYLLKTHSTLSESDLSKSTDSKLELVREKFPSFRIENIFSAVKEISLEINQHEWQKSFLLKPRVWIRIRKPFRQRVIDELNQKEIAFEEDESSLTLSFPQDVALEKTEAWRRGEFEIQDRSSQLTRKYFGPHKNENWWDACAGSGGKSLLLIEEEPTVRLFATDSRKSILDNYRERIMRSGHTSFRTEVLDLSAGDSKTPNEKFEGIIVDVPCTGSGTWARSPEWLKKNNISEMLNHYVPLQRRIVSNVLPALKTGFPLIFITCSVFREENEENVRYFLDQLPLKLEKSTYLEGYRHESDTLFIARFTSLS